MKPYYEDKGISIFQGDCREILSSIKFDLMVTDPPYGVTQQSWDTKESVIDVIGMAPLAVFTTGERLLADLIQRYPDRFRHIWVWDRVNRQTDFLNASRRPLRVHELIAVFSVDSQYGFNPVKRAGHTVSRRKRSHDASGSYGEFKKQKDYGETKTELHPTSIISFPANKTNSQVHPTEKPVSLYRYLLESYTSEMVVDPYMGSGTTLVAAKELGRKVVGIEIEEKYCEIAARRLSQGCFVF